MLMSIWFTKPDLNNYMAIRKAVSEMAWPFFFCLYLKGVEVISETDADKINEWLRKFQVSAEQDGFDEIDDQFALELARAMCDECPLGYEASHRIASWLFWLFDSHANK